jgi:hypothetical protein
MEVSFPWKGGGSKNSLLSMNGRDEAISPERRIRLRQSLPASRNHGSLRMIADFRTRPTEEKIYPGKEGEGNLR